MTLLAVASLVPGKHKPGDSVFIWLAAKTPSHIQNTLHVLLYAVLTLLLIWALEGIESRTIRLFSAFAIALAFGVAMEWGQTRVPGRFGTLYDVLLNAAGAALGVLVAIFLVQRHARHIEFALSPLMVGR